MATATKTPQWAYKGVDGTGKSVKGVLEASSEAQAIQRVFDAIHAGRPTPDLLTYQYLKETLPKVADGQAMKLMLVPSDAQAALGAAAALGGGFNAGQGMGFPAGSGS